MQSCRGSLRLRPLQKIQPTMVDPRRPPRSRVSGPKLSRERKERGALHWIRLGTDRAALRFARLSSINSSAALFPDPSGPSRALPRIGLAGDGAAPRQLHRDGAASSRYDPRHSVPATGRAAGPDPPAIAVADAGP